MMSGTGLYLNFPFLSRKRVYGKDGQGPYFSDGLPAVPERDVRVFFMDGKKDKEFTCPGQDRYHFCDVHSNETVYLESKNDEWICPECQCEYVDSRTKPDLTYMDMHKTFDINSKLETAQLFKNEKRANEAARWMKANYAVQDTEVRFVDREARDVHYNGYVLVLDLGPGEHGEDRLGYFPKGIYDQI